MPQYLTDADVGIGGMDDAAVGLAGPATIPENEPTTIPGKVGSAFVKGLYNYVTGQPSRQEGYLTGMGDIPREAAKIGVHAATDLLPNDTLLGRMSADLKSKLDTNLAARQAAMPQNDSSFNIGRVGGNVAATLPAGLMAGGGTLPAIIARGAAQGATSGALMPSDANDPNFWRTKAVQAGVGGATGAATSALAGGLAKGAQIRAARGQVPTLDELKSGAEQAYKLADQAGVVVKPNVFSNAVTKIKTAIKQGGFHPKIQPKIDGVINALDEAADKGPQSLGDLELLRRVIKNAAKSTDDSERRLAMIAAGELDDFVNGLQQSDLASGSAKGGVTALNYARKLWSRYGKGEDIADLIDRAKTRAPNFVGSGRENALRTEFRQFAMNERKMRMFTPEEQAAIRKVAEGGSFDNMMRALGRLAPRGVISGIMAPGIAVGALGPAGLAVPAAGEVGREVATGLTSRNANMAAEMMRRGSALKVAKGLSPQEIELLRLLTAGSAPTAAQ